MRCVSIATVIGNYTSLWTYFLMTFSGKIKLIVPFHSLLIKKLLLSRRIEKVDKYLIINFLWYTFRNTRSESCPFCRGSLRRVNSEDLWVLTCTDDVVDAETVSKEDLFRFYLYINSLPKDMPDALFLVYYEYLFWFLN